ncbi:MAG: LamG-like jellyroll fold domain-containing protein, partial [Planctomycetota bacterium]
VYDSIKKSLSYYIDGKLDSKFTLENTGPVELGPLRIACHDITNHNFDGQIDDVQIYGYPLSDKHIAKVYAGQMIKEPTNITAVFAIAAAVIVIALVSTRFRKNKLNNQQE